MTDLPPHARPPEGENSFQGAVAAFRGGRIDDVIRMCRHLAAAAPGDFNPRQLLGAAHYRRGEWSLAEASFRDALALRPESAETWFNLAKTCAAQRRWREAEESNRRGLALRPQDAAALDHWGVCLREIGELEQAAFAHQKCLLLAPGDPAALNNLAIVEALRGRFTAAVEVFVQLGKQQPQVPEVHANLGNVLRDLGRSQLAEDAYTKALAVNPGHSLAWAGRLLNALYSPEITQAERFRWHVEWARLTPLTSTLPKPPIRNLAGLRIRVGYVSSDLYHHSVAHFTLPLFLAHDRSSFEIHAFSNHEREDAMTHHLRAAVDHWHDIRGHKPADVAGEVAERHIDVLVDLNGHTGRANLDVFRHRPARVHVTYLGYPDTTGLTEMDFRLTDELVDPPGEQDRFHTERLWRLPPPAWCYCPPAAAPEPAIRVSDAPVVFGSFNNPAKLNDRVFDVWVSILAAEPSSRLVLKGKTLSDPEAARRVIGAFATRGIARERLSVRGWAAYHQDHLAQYQDVDIALDSFPYAGTTTTCEAMWMGVPVVTLVGGEHRSRVGLSLLSAVGLKEGIATSPAEYVSFALQLARDPQRRGALRRELRGRMQSSALMNGRQFVRNLENAYRAMLDAVAARV